MSTLAEVIATFLLFFNLHLSFFFSKYLCKDAFLLVEPSKRVQGKKEKEEDEEERVRPIIEEENGAMS